MTRSTITIAALLSFSLATNDCFAQPFAGDYRTEGLSGEPIPGTVSNELVSNIPLFEAPLIDNLGRTTFKANTSAGDQVLISAQQEAYRTGTQVVGAEAGTTYQLLNGVVVNDSNDIVMSALFSGPPISSANNFGVVQRLNGTTRSIKKASQREPLERPWATLVPSGRTSQAIFPSLAFWKAYRRTCMRQSCTIIKGE